MTGVTVAGKVRVSTKNGAALAPERAPHEQAHPAARRLPAAPPARGRSGVAPLGELGADGKAHEGSRESPGAEHRSWPSHPPSIHPSGGAVAATLTRLREHTLRVGSPRCGAESVSQAEAPLVGKPHRTAPPPRDAPPHPGRADQKRHTASGVPLWGRRPWQGGCRSPVNAGGGGTPGRTDRVRAGRPCRVREPTSWPRYR